jgi:hypothetical protein
VDCPAKQNSGLGLITARHEQLHFDRHDRWCRAAPVWGNHCRPGCRAEVGEPETPAFSATRNRSESVALIAATDTIVIYRHRRKLLAEVTVDRPIARVLVTLTTAPLRGDALAANLPEGLTVIQSITLMLRVAKGPHFGMARDCQAKQRAHD